MRVLIASKNDNKLDTDRILDTSDSVPRQRNNVFIIQTTSLALEIYEPAIHATERSFVGFDELAARRIWLGR